MKTYKELVKELEEFKLKVNADGSISFNTTKEELMKVFSFFMTDKREDVGEIRDENFDALLKVFIKIVEYIVEYALDNFQDVKEFVERAIADMKKNNVKHHKTLTNTFDRAMGSIDKLEKVVFGPKRDDGMLN